jgi:hypothetical protein
MSRELTNIARKILVDQPKGQVGALLFILLLLRDRGV